jgi:hypothetical protein
MKSMDSELSADEWVASVRAEMEALADEWEGNQSLILCPGWMARDKCIADLRAAARRHS